MLVFDLRTIGNKLFTVRKHTGMTQAEIAEAAGLSERAYADIERGTVNMRIETILRICSALHITPNDILTEESTISERQEEIINRLSACSPKERDTALSILAAFFNSLN